MNFFKYLFTNESRWADRETSWQKMLRISREEKVSEQDEFEQSLAFASVIGNLLPESILDGMLYNPGVIFVNPNHECYLKSDSEEMAFE